MSQLLIQISHIIDITITHMLMSPHFAYSIFSLIEFDVHVTFAYKLNNLMACDCGYHKWRSNVANYNSL